MLRVNAFEAIARSDDALACWNGVHEIFENCSSRFDHFFLTRFTTEHQYRRASIVART
jgi:hypothetical protein